MQTGPLVGHGRHHLFDIKRVARVQNREIEHGSEDRDIVGRPVTGAVAGGQTRQPANNLDAGPNEPTWCPSSALNANATMVVLGAHLIQLDRTYDALWHYSCQW